MIRVIEKTEAIRTAFTRAMRVSIGENADIILVNIEYFGGVEANEVKNAVNESVLKKLREYASTKPVTLWTGGKWEEAEKILASQKITDFPLVSKYDFEGCRVEIVIDDLNEKEFRERYHIASGKYIKV